jgi:hypothetical protein
LAGFAASPLRRALNQALARYEEWERPLRSYRAEEMRRLNKDGFTWDMFDRGLRELAARLQANFDPWVAIHPLVEQLCAAYVAGDGAERAEIRAFAAQRKSLGDVLGRFANQCAARVTCAADGPRVAQALTALAIENCPTDYRDTLMTLADLYVAAEQAGVDPRALFAAASELATDEFTPGGCESMARMLREFHGYSVLRERRGMDGPYGGPA